MKAGEAFVFVMAGDPFSLNAVNDPSHMTSQLDLVNSSNVQFQNVELQIWQGKGSKYSLKRYVWFALIIFLIVWIYRVIVQRNADKFEDLFNATDRVNVLSGFDDSAAFLSTLAFDKFQRKEFEDVAYFEPFYLKDFLVTTAKKKVGLS